MNSELDNRMIRQGVLLESIIDQLIQFVLSNPLQEMLSRTMSPIQYAKECRTLRLDVGRGTGKTHYILTHINDEKDYVIFPTRNYYWQRVAEDFKQVAYANNITDLMGKNMKDVEKIFIDQASTILYDDMIKVYETFERQTNPNRIYIVLG